MPLNGIIHAMKKCEIKKSGISGDIEGIVLQQFERRMFDGTHSSYDLVISITCPESESHSGLRISYIPLNNRVKISVDQVKELKGLNPDELKKRILSRFGYLDSEKTLSIDNSVYKAIINI
jgi:hypothetical protein